MAIEIMHKFDGKDEKAEQYREKLPLIRERRESERIFTVLCRTNGI